MSDSTSVIAGGEDFFVLPGLRHEIRGAALHGFHHRVDTAVGGDHHDDEFRIDFEDSLQPSQALPTTGFTWPKIHVEQNRVEAIPFQQARNVLGIAAQDDLGKSAAEQQAAGSEDVRIVIHYQNVTMISDHEASPPAWQSVRNRTVAVRFRTVFLRQKRLL